MSWRDRTFLGLKLAGFFSWSGRANRVQFFARYLIVCVIGALLGAMIVLPVLWIGEAIWGQSTASMVAFALHSVLLAALLAVTSSLLAQRAHDLGMSARVPLAAYVGALVLSFIDLLAWPAVLIPHLVTRSVMVVTALFFLWLLFAKGQPHENRFGLPP